MRESVGDRTPVAGGRRKAVLGIAELLARSLVGRVAGLWSPVKVRRFDFRLDSLT